jgi:hypothetical protein
MHVKSLLHVRDHSKATGPAHHMLEYIALHVNAYTGEAFELTVDRIAHRLQVSPQWVGQLRRQLLASGELLIKQSHGRRPNVYVIPYERCHLCQQANPNVEFMGDDFNPKVEFGVDDLHPMSTPPSNPKVTPNQPQSNPKVEEGASAYSTGVTPEKAVKEERENNVGTNVGIDREPRTRRIRLTLKQEEVVEELETQFDTHSRGAFCVLVSDYGLGEEITYRCLRETMDAEEDGRITTTPVQYFMDLCMREAARQGIDLGFKRPGT